MYKKIILSAIFAFALSFSVQAQTVAGNWKLTSLVVESDMVYSMTEPITLNIDENGKISGFGGCNSYSGKYQFKQPKKIFKKPKKINFSELFQPIKNANWSRIRKLLF